MSKYLFVFLTTISTLLSCKDNNRRQQPSAKDTSFSRFEISYSNGWTPDFTFLVDSTHIYFSPKALDTVYYGVVPDSLIRSIQASITAIRRDSSIQSNEINCKDCKLMSMEAVVMGDTVKLFQAGYITPVAGKLIAQLKQYLESTNQHAIPSTMSFNTRYDAVEAPPKIIKTGN